MVPAIEARSNIRMSSSTRSHLRCAVCRRTSSNRGICEHEAVVLRECDEFDSELKFDVISDNVHVNSS